MMNDHTSFYVLWEGIPCLDKRGDECHSFHHPCRGNDELAFPEVGTLDGVALLPVIGAHLYRSRERIKLT